LEPPHRKHILDQIRTKKELDICWRGAMAYEAAAAVAMKGQLQHRGKKGGDQVAKEKKPRRSSLRWIVKKVYSGRPLRPIGGNTILLAFIHRGRLGLLTNLFIHV
jgi:hypothetical protein